MTEDGPASKGSDQASEGHPREGRHRLLNFIDPSWQCLSLKPELIVNHLLCLHLAMVFTKIKPGNQDGKKDHPGLAFLLALFCCQMDFVCKSEWPKSFSGFVLVSGFLAMLPNDYSYQYHKQSNGSMSSPGGQDVLEVRDQASSQPSPAGEVIDARVRLT